MTKSILGYLRGSALVFALLGSGHSMAEDALALARTAISNGAGTEALTRLLPLALSGNSDACYWLGRLYFYDVPGVPQDDHQSSRWFAQAARNGHADAQYKLGGMYYTGRGVVASLPQAAAWWKLAAKQGQPEALNNFGALLATGTGLARDPELALALQILASQKGSEAASENLGRKKTTEQSHRLAKMLADDPVLLGKMLDTVKTDPPEVP